MTDYVDAWPTARRRHRCGVCRRSILPGETYWRQAALDRSGAWTSKTCEHCERVVWAYCRVLGESEWDQECALEWLSDEHPADLAALAAGWRWPDGDLVPVPFGSTCAGCRARVEFRTLRCPPCDERRIARIDAARAGYDSLAWADAVNAGRRWCHRCQAFEPGADFGRDGWRWDGLTTSCLRSRRRGRS